MPKRRLTKQQRLRIKRQSEKKAQAHTAHARDPDNDDRFGDIQQGIVVGHFGGEVAVEPWPFQTPHTQRRCHIRANLEQLVAGDHVLWRDHPEVGIVEARQERKNQLQRPDRFGKLQTTAANIDFVIIVFAAEPEPQPLHIDSYLVAAGHANISPILVFNKCDLAASDQYSELVQCYKHLGYSVFKTSAKAQHNLDALSQHLQNAVSVMVGQSGVGKSSLMNALIPDVDVATAALSEKSRLGSHTTTTSQLFHCPHGGAIIDSPGIREFGLTHLDRETILQGFPEIAATTADCQFRNCSHQQEPGCALKAAIQEQKIPASRLASFTALNQALDDNAATHNKSRHKNKS